MKKNLKTIWILTGIFGAIIIIYTLFIFFYIKKINNSYQTAIESMRETDSSMDKVNRSLLLLSGDINQMRWAVNLPSVTYPASDSSSVTKSNDFTTSVFDAIGKLSGLLKENAIFAKIEAVKNHPVIRDFLLLFKMTIKEIDTYHFSIVIDQSVYYTINYDVTRDIFGLSAITGTAIEFQTPDTDVRNFLEANKFPIEEHYKLLAAKLANFQLLHTDKAIQTLLTEKGLQLSAATDDGSAYKIEIQKGAKSIVSILLNKSDLNFIINNNFFAEFALFKAAFLKSLTTLDTRSEVQRTVDKLKFDLINALNTPDILSQLEKLEFRVLPYTESGDAIYFPVVDKQGTKAGGFLIRKQDFDGEITLVNNIDQQIGFLRNLEKIVSE